MRSLLARAVTLATVLVAGVMVAVTAVWGWNDAVARTEARVRTQSDVVAAVVAAGADPDVLRAAVAATAAGERGHLAVHLPDGTTVGASHALPGDARESARSGEPAEVPVEGGTAYLFPARGAAVEVYVPRGEVVAELGRTMAVLVLVAVLSVGGAVALADRLSRPARLALGALAGTAVAIGEGRLNARVRVRGPRDLVVLGESINAIGDRVQGLLDREREMAADVSHRLRTPLTALRLDAEALAGPEGDRIREAVGALEQDVDDIIRNVRPADGAGPRECDLAEAVGDRMGFWSLLASDQGRDVEVRLPETRARVGLSREECAAVLDALVGNVFRYTPAGSPFAVTVVCHAGWVTLIVEDAGPGFADPVRALRRGTSGGGSTGLGLDIVRHAVETTGGTIHLERGKLGGARVRSRFAELGVPHGQDQPRAWRLRRSG
ncbi:sensor histidine kinase [Nocardiopsis sp. NPDC050513]|uniref:sensor histidine kinase n=1 Tax=Nocardiopsis sp. NPDC050513 TaxID=3364338 RepID=UPI0037A3E08E